MVKKQQKRTETGKKAMLEALRKTLGIVTDAAKLSGIERTSHYRWMEDDIEYKTAVKEIDDIAIDFAESHLLKQIKEKDTTATIFFLKTRGKKRGYVERMEQEISGPGGGSLIIQLDNDCAPIKGQDHKGNASL